MGVVGSSHGCSAAGASKVATLNSLVDAPAGAVLGSFRGSRQVQLPQLCYMSGRACPLCSLLSGHRGTHMAAADEPPAHGSAREAAASSAARKVVVHTREACAASRKCVTHAFVQCAAALTQSPQLIWRLVCCMRAAWWRCVSIVERAIAPVFSTVAARWSSLARCPALCVTSGFLGCPNAF